MFAIYRYLQGPECPVVYGGLQRLQKYSPACWANRGHLTSVAAVIWIKYHRRSSKIRSPNVTIYVKSLQILSEFETLLKDNWKEWEAITSTLELAQVTYCLCEKHCSLRVSNKALTEKIITTNTVFGICDKRFLRNCYFMYSHFSQKQFDINMDQF